LIGFDDEATSQKMLSALEKKESSADGKKKRRLNQFERAAAEGAKFVSRK
jgi:hypothetical protein